MFTLMVQILTDSEKCFTPSADDAHHFVIPFRPYAWTYSGSELRNLVQRTYHHLPTTMESDAQIAIYGPEDSGTDSPMYTQQGPNTGFYRDYSSTSLYRMRHANELYSDLKLRAKASEIKSESNFICSRLEPSGLFKCIKCCKVCMNTVIVLNQLH